MDHLERLSMPPCPDCHKPWTMSPAEKLLWDSRVALDGAVFPKRCHVCRARRRKLLDQNMLCSKGVELLIEEYNSGDISPDLLLGRLQTVLYDVLALERRLHKGAEK